MQIKTRRVRFLLAMAAVIISPSVGHAICGNTTASSSSASLLDRLESKKVSVRHSFDGSKNESRPGIVSYIDKEGERAFYSVDLGVKLGECEFGERSIQTIFPSVEWHRSTAEKSEVNKYSAGLNWEGIWGNLRRFNPDGTAQPPAFPGEVTRLFGFFALAKGKIFRDEVAGSDSRSYSFFLSTKSNKPYLPGAVKEDANGALILRYYPYLGAERFDGVKLPAAGSAVPEKVDVSFLTARVSAEFFPLGGAARRQVQLLFEYTWRDHIGGADLSENSPSLFVAELNYFLDPKQRASLGYTFEDGEKPDNDFRSGKTSAISLKLKI